MSRRGAGLAAGWLLAAACGGDAGTPAPAGEAPAAAGPVFSDRAAATGLDFAHYNGMTGELHIVEEMGAGAALFDYDGDGDLDAYLVQGTDLPGADPAAAVLPPRHPRPLSDRLYRNELVETGTLGFTDVTAAAGLPPAGHGMGVAAGDYDGDGRVDLYVTAWGGNRLLRNAGGGRFEDATVAAGADDPRWSVPAVFFDYDGDGRLDLYVGNYVELPDELPSCTDAAGAPDYCGPASFAPQPDRLLANAGGGRFVDVTAASGLAAAPARPALGALAADLDGDHRVDLYVANDAEPNNLWINLGGGRFEDRALLAGVAVDGAGKAEGSMGVDAGDVDGDGEYDLVATHLVTETNTLWLGRGGGLYEDGTAASGLGAPSRLYTGFGAAWLDYDNDGRLDLLVVNGAVNRIPELVRRGEAHPLHQVNQLFRNLGQDAAGRPRFAEVGAAAGAALNLSEVSRGAAFGDVDNDGDTDVLVTNNAGPVRLLINRVGQDRPWLGLRLVTGEPPRDALGAGAVLVAAGGRPVARARVRADGSYASASDPRLLFGLSRLPAPEWVRVAWADGSAESFPAPPAGRYTTLKQGSGRPLPGGAG